MSHLTGMCKKHGVLYEQCTRCEDEYETSQAAPSQEPIGPTFTGATDKAAPSQDLVEDNQCGVVLCFAPSQEPATKDYDDWFRSKQGTCYDSMYVFARDAWNDAKADVAAQIAELTRQRDIAVAALKKIQKYQRTTVATWDMCDEALRQIEGEDHGL